MSRPTKDFTWEDLADKIDNEGFEYYFCHYESPSSFTDKKLRDLATKFVAAQKELHDYLVSKGGVL